MVYVCMLLTDESHLIESIYASKMGYCCCLVAQYFLLVMTLVAIATNHELLTMFAANHAWIKKRHTKQANREQLIQFRHSLAFLLFSFPSI